MKFIILFLAKIAAFSILLSVAGYFAYVTTILTWSKPNFERDSHTSLYDAIIVLTGGPKRIETAFTLLLDQHAPRLLVSGVLNRVPIDDIIENNAQNFNAKQIETLQNHCCITLDYIADTTETNAIESAKWIKANGAKNIILVTSASHMPRAYLQFARNLGGDVEITSYPTKRGDEYDLVISRKFWSYALREYIKFIGSWIRLEKT